MVMLFGPYRRALEYAMARDRSTPVPHHLVEASLYDAAVEKAEGLGLSMSKVAARGLDALAASAPPEIADEAKKSAQGDLTEPSRVQALPPETALLLKRMRQNRDVLLNPYLVVLTNAGWSYAALSEPLGISRQAIYDRVRKWRGVDLPDGLPSAPEPPFQPATPYSLGYERVDWPIWVDRETYAIASREAKRRMTPMRVVMENILRDFINDRGPWKQKV